MLSSTSCLNAWQQRLQKHCTLGIIIPVCRLSCLRARSCLIGNLRQLSPLCQLQCLMSACRYNVYADLQASANYLELKANGEYLDQAQAAFANLQVSFS